MTHSGPRRVRLTRTVRIPDDARIARWASAPEHGPRIVLFTGGSGSGGLARAVSTYTRNTTHVIPMFDDGGSSRLIREALDMPPPGDLRNRIGHLTVAERPGLAEAIRLFTRRLGSARPKEEFMALTRGEHPFQEGLPPEMRAAFRVPLVEFHRTAPETFDFTGASVGNLILAGLYLMFDRDLEAAVHLCASLLDARGEVVPAALANGHLAVELANGDLVYGQSCITKGERRARGVRITRLMLVAAKEKNAPPVRMPVNPRVQDAIEHADLIVFSVGSFYTSLLPSLLLEGVGEALARSSATKVMVANALADHETVGLRLSDLVGDLVRYCREGDSELGAGDFVDIVVANNHGNTATYRGIEPDPVHGIHGHIPVDVSAVEQLGVGVLEIPLEIPSKIGHFDPERLARILVSMA